MNKSTAKKITVCVWVVLAIIALIIWHFVAELIEYQSGLKYLEQGKYEQAEKIFSDNMDYKNSEKLYNFSRYLQAKNDSDGGYYYMDNIPESYRGEFSDWIKEERGKVEKKHQERLAEQAKKEKKLEEEFRVEVKNMLPYVGMDTKYIRDTLVGQYDKVTDDDDYRKGKDGSIRTYSWYSDDGKELVLIVVARYDPDAYGFYVERVEKFNTDIYWTADGRPNFGAKRPAQTTSKRKYYDDDDYDVWGYDNPEDLYYDNPDMFEGYEEAYDFFYDMIEE